MPTVFSSAAAEFVVERSRFAAKTFYLPHPDELQTCLDAMKSCYPHADHYPWAYRITASQQRGFDDGEPHQTAGLPMLLPLIHQDWTQTAVIAARYFGGTKLGRGGLTRAYQSACLQALAATVQARTAELHHVTLSIAYPDYHRVAPWLSRASTEWNEDFGDHITLRFCVERRAWPNLQARLDATCPWHLVDCRTELGRIPLGAPDA
ncbi:MAG: YigZ family protein [Firmicutes bacterium]|nr:YigZ family protein [Bacillota bacterium]